MSVISSIISSFSEEFRQVVFDQQGASEYAQYLSNRPAKLEVVLDDCNEAVRDDGDVNLYPDSILRVTPERFDLEMLLDPFEEKFHLPAIAVKQGNLLGREVEVVGVIHKGTPQISRIIDNPAQFGRIITFIASTCESDGLVKEYTVSSVEHILPIDNLKLGLSFLPNDEESPTDLYLEESVKVEISSVKDIAGIGLVFNPVHSLVVADLGVCDSVEYGDLCGDVNLGVDFDAGLCTAEKRPTEDGHTEVDCSGINCIEASVEFKLFGDSPFLGKRHHIEREFLEDSRLAEHIGFRESVSDDDSCPKSEIERPFSMSSCYICKFPEASAAYQLPEHEHEQVVPMGETPSLGSVRILCGNPPELPLWQVHCDLSKNVASCMHNRSDFDSDHNIRISKVGHKFCRSKRYA